MEIIYSTIVHDFEKFNARKILKLKIIENESFVSTNIDTLIIPLSVEEFQELFCSNAQDLISITIIESNDKSVYYFDNKFIHY